MLTRCLLRAAVKAPRIVSLVGVCCRVQALPGAGVSERRRQLVAMAIPGRFREVLVASVVSRSSESHVCSSSRCSPQFSTLVSTAISTSRRQSALTIPILFISRFIFMQQSPIRRGNGKSLLRRREEGFGRGVENFNIIRSIQKAEERKTE